MELWRERVTTELLDPSHGFERIRQELELRRDPLTGQSCRLLPPGSLTPPVEHDLQLLAEQTRPTCPFCGPSVERVTPRFPPELIPEGRIRRGEALLFPNLLPYAKWSSVSVYSPERHLLCLDELTPELVADNLLAQVEFARAVLRHDLSSRWISINANQLPPSGSSIFHPHLQGSGNPTPTTVQRLLAELEPGTLGDYLRLERAEHDRVIGSTGCVEWLAAFAPAAPAEIRGLVHGAASPEGLDDAAVGDVAAGLSRVLRAYAELGFQSFNLACYGNPTTDEPLLLVRVVGRAYYGPLNRSDAMWSERLHAEAATDLAPETLAERARRVFAAAGPSA